MKTALVTGSTSGIGSAIVRRLRADDWDVIGLSHHELDLSDLGQVAKAAKKLTGEIEHLDALVHVAGIWHDKKEAFAERDLEDYTAEQIAATMNVGVTSFMILAAALLPKLKKDGAVVGISGTFSDGASGWLPYYTSKRALEDFLVGLADDYPKGPRVYGISPADTATAAYAKFFPEYIDEAQPPEAVAELLLQLLGKNIYKTGEIIELRAQKAKPNFHA